MSKCTKPEVPKVVGSDPIFKLLFIALGLVVVWIFYTAEFRRHFTDVVVTSDCLVLINTPTKREEVKVRYLQSLVYDKSPDENPKFGTFVISSYTGYGPPEFYETSNRNMSAGNNMKNYMACKRPKT